MVIDEAHTYTGAFGAHVAVVLRRLLRLALRYARRGLPPEAEASASSQWSVHVLLYLLFVGLNCGVCSRLALRYARRGLPPEAEASALSQGRRSLLISPTVALPVPPLRTPPQQQQQQPTPPVPI